MSVVLVLFLLGMNAKFLFPGFLKGRKKRYFKESFSAFGEGNALLFWFCSIQQGSMKGLKKRARQRWWACTGRIRVFVFNKT